MAQNDYRNRKINEKLNEKVATAKRVYQERKMRASSFLDWMERNAFHNVVL